MREEKRTGQHRWWKLITLWLLTVMLAVTMSMPATSFASGDSHSKEKKVTKSAKESKKDKKDKKDKKKKDKKKKDKKKKKKDKKKKHKKKKSKNKKKDKDKKKHKKKDKKNKKKHNKKKHKKKKLRNCYRVKINDKGVMKCWWINKKGKKSKKRQRDKYFIVYFDKGSKIKGIGRKKIGDYGKLYYFNKKGKGKRYTGWYREGNKKFYFKDGKRYRGIKRISRTWFEFSPESGRLWRRIGDGVDRNNQSYSSLSKYLIVVRLKKHQVRVYKGSKNDWKRLHKWKCVTGKSSTPTPKGTFVIGTRGLHFDTGTNMRVWYYTQFWGSYFFHSTLYDRQSEPNNCVSYRLGQSRSHGCIRLDIKNAKWIYDHVPRGTKVIIY